MSDLEAALDFFARLKAKGFRVELKDYSGWSEGDEEFNPSSVSFQLYSSEDTPFIEFDFKDGKFYRISGFTSGYWQDEVDWKKYT